MMRFLLHRPIAVTMTFLAFIIIGIATSTSLPISLLPDIPIPEITIQITGENTSARALERTAIAPLRQQLLQVGNLRDIQSETRDANGIIHLKFDYGTDVDLAFIEVNEKIDGIMGQLPKNISRPKVIKASATDIPVFYLNITQKNDRPYGETNEDLFLSLSEFVNNIVKRRIEQLPQVSMADITGYMKQYVRIIPDEESLKIFNLHLSDIENALYSNNIEPGSMIVRDGYYEYNIKFSSVLRTVKDIENIYFYKGNRLFQLKDFAKVQLSKKNETGMTLVNGKRGITLAIIKQSDATLDDLKESLNKTINNLKDSYPNIEFTINRNQTELLDYTIGNLKTNLMLGFLLVFLVAVFFLGDIKSPIVIGISIISALIISFIFFYIFKQSLNIISLSGIILALGMMIDSAIIVTDIITQYREKGETVFDACVKGTNEVITPILSSTFTTIAIFIPLVFLGGISGAIFFAQAFAVSVGLIVSYFTGIILLPVLYYLIYSSRRIRKFYFLEKVQKTIDRKIFLWYERGFNFIYRHRKLFFTFFICSLPMSFFIFQKIPKSNMPFLDHNELVLTLEWNENIHIDENKKRVNEILKEIENISIENMVYIGNKQYLLDNEYNLSNSESEIYIKAKNTSDIYKIENRIKSWLRKKYPKSIGKYSPPENIFEKIFDTNEPDIIAKFYPTNKAKQVTSADIEKLKKEIDKTTGISSDKVAFEEQIIITIDREKLLIYNVDYKEVERILKTAFNSEEIAILRSYQQYLPIALASSHKTVNEFINSTMVRSNMKENNQYIEVPLQALLSTSKEKEMKTIIAGNNGEYIPFFYSLMSSPNSFLEKIENHVKKDREWNVKFSGNFFSGKKMLGELLVILLISILLMYFILAAQFESFVQPLIVFAELPIDISFALIILWFSGNTLNLMSAIGIVVSCGIIINDSILKIDMINELRKNEIPLLEAIHIAGKKRLRSIIMTSLTTIFAMTPLLFSYDLGSELQKPFAVAMIAAMSIGTFVSLYIIPLIYWLIYKKSKYVKN